MTVASRLGLSLQRCQQETTATEFHKWLMFFQEEDAKKWESVQKWEYYAARLCARVGNLFSKHMRREQDDIIKFKMGSDHPKTPEKPVTKEERIKEAKSFWSLFFSMNKAVQKKLKKDKI